MKMLNRLRRIEGQMRGIEGMIEGDDDLERIAQQFSAVRKAMDRAFFELMSCATKSELAELGISHPKAEARLDEITALLARYG